MRRRPDFFPAWQVEILAAGEATGRVDAACRSVAELLEERRSLALAMAPALLYPCLMAVAAPFFLYAGDWVSRPWGFPVYYLRFALQIALPLGGAAAAVSWAVRSSRAPARLPLVGTFFKAQFCFYLGALIRAGVPFPRALDTAAAASGLPAARAASGAGAEGLSAAERLRRLDAFSDSELGEIEAAETAGRLDEALERLSSRSRELWKAAARSAAAVLPPAIYLLILLSIAARIVSFWKGYFRGIDEILGH